MGYNDYGEVREDHPSFTGEKVCRVLQVCCVLQ